MADQKVILTYADYQNLPDNGTRKEVLGGELFVAPAPTPRHQHVVGTVYAALKTHIDARRLGEVLPSPIDVVLTATDIMQPDIVFVAERRRNIIGDAAIHGAPDLVVEVLSPGTAAVDRGRKREAYARAAVAEYWIVDPEARGVEVYHLEGDAYRLTGRAERGAWTPALFPGLVITLDALWGD
ncbi:MAG TPA: Uma2 family endonuclease [bacterium]|nr:Uma2 family endonuclease [bacterium]